MTQDDVNVDSLIALALAPPHNIDGRDDIITVNGLLHLLRVLTVSQGQGKTAAVGIDININSERFLDSVRAYSSVFETGLDIRKSGLRFRHLGIPKAEKQYFEDCIKASGNGPVTESDAIQLWDNTFFSVAPPEQFDMIVALLKHIWTILPKYPGGKAMDVHACTIGLYLSGMAAENLFIPYSLPSHIYYTIFTWFQKTDEEDSAEPVKPSPAMELIQQLDIDAIALALSNNIGRALNLNIPTINYVEAPEEPMVSSSSQGHTFLQIGHTELNKMSRDALSLAFCKRFYRLQAQFWKSSASNQTMVQTAVNLSVHTNDQTRRERKHSRKKKHFENRQDIILAHPEWDSGYREAHEALGVDGTSSDESESEMYSNRFFRIPQPWRSQKLDRMINRIDAARDEAARQKRRFPRSGRIFRVRVGDHPTKLSITVPPGLPLNFYNQAWLSTHLEVSKWLSPAPYTRIPQIDE
ncbi:hypothetical protein M422DRAFT_275263 [Sphaerobolus stellatus SS14]|uniref:Uncharacterized protein n=1 Tax=Sphaerobolus stellatus (strain SS14) TaxID=990650 RepID=A0A0C9UF02_SPHS4|nr:hypothetical protein M422DRAFT_275263 [Sphaerobolus stellatus SS14]